MMVAECFEKIRINPGNFADGRKTFEVINYDDPREFDRERAEIEEVFTPLVQKCKELGRAMRIGTNHGSLSARILSYYGDTPRYLTQLACTLAACMRCVWNHAACLCSDIQHWVERAYILKKHVHWDCHVTI